MPAYHLHIEGQVQGVGFRPNVYRIARKLSLKGWVSNGVDGVHIEIAGEEKYVQKFTREVLQHAPKNAIILHYTFHEIDSSDYNEFEIRESSSAGVANVLLTPDLGLCEDCRDEILDPSNRRYHYPFTTCIHCGPRYSIVQRLPYDRENTTMHSFQQCAPCTAEYGDVDNRRYYSQTNSCSSCGVSLQMMDRQGVVVSEDRDTIIDKTCAALEDGKIVCLKGIGGFLLLTDACNEEAIMTLRNRKHRPSKPFALLYPNLEKIKEDAEVSFAEETSLKSIQAPIVLLKLKGDVNHNISVHALAPGLNRIGVMLPYNPLLAILMEKWKKPLVATSGNISGSPFSMSMRRRLTTCHRSQTILSLTTVISLYRRMTVLSNFHPPPNKAYCCGAPGVLRQRMCTLPVAALPGHGSPWGVN